MSQAVAKETGAVVGAARDVVQASDVAAASEPPGNIGAPIIKGPTLAGPLTAAWARYPRRGGSFKFEDVAACGRRDAGLVANFTGTESAWALPARARFVRHFVGSYQVPSTVPCDRTFEHNRLDGLYLEAME